MKIFITTSWDDEHKNNLKIVELLNRYNIKGTFYLNGQDLSAAQIEIIKDINKTQEVGAHTLTHPKLTEIDRNKAAEEVVGSKHYLESIIDDRIKMFAYPYGLFNEPIKNIVKKAGFLGARTTKSLSISLPTDFFEMNATIQTYPFPLRKRDANTLHLTRHLLDPLIHNFSGISRLKLPLSSYLNWSTLAKNSFDKVMTEGGVWHLWGHGADIKRYNLWSDLEYILKYIAGRKDTQYLTNSQVLENL